MTVYEFIDFSFFMLFGGIVTGLTLSVIKNWWI